MVMICHVCMCKRSDCTVRVTDTALHVLVVAVKRVLPLPCID